MAGKPERTAKHAAAMAEAQAVAKRRKELHDEAAKAAKADKPVRAVKGAKKGAGRGRGRGAVPPKPQGRGRGRGRGH